MIVEEKTTKIQQRFERILADKSRTTFWKEKRAMTRNPVLESLIIKDDQGRRIYSPEGIKETNAQYFEKPV